jgi:hypothetical protein
MTQIVDGSSGVTICSLANDLPGAALTARFAAVAPRLLMRPELRWSVSLQRVSPTERLDEMEATTGGSGSLGSELRSDARTITDSAAQRLHSEVDARKGGAVDQAKAVSSALDRAAAELGQDGPTWLQSAVKSVSRSVQQLAETVEGKDSRTLTRDVQQLARDHPGSFLAACAFAGFAAARVMQAGARPGGNGKQGVTGQTQAGSSIDEPAISLPAGAEAYVAPGYGGAGL